MEDRGDLSDSSLDDEPLCKVARRRSKSESSDDVPLAVKQRMWTLQDEIDDSDNDPDYCFAKDAIATSDSNFDESDDTCSTSLSTVPLGALPSMQTSKSISLPSTSSSEPFAQPSTSSSEPITLPSTSSSEPITLPSTSSSEPITLPSTSSSEPFAQPSTSSSEPITLPSTSSSVPIALPSTSSSEPIALPSTSSSVPIAQPSTSSSVPIALPSTSSSVPIVLPSTSSSEPIALPSTSSSEPITLPSTSSSVPIAQPSTSPSEPIALPFTSSSEPIALPCTSSSEPIALPSTSSSEPIALPSTSSLEHIALPSTSSEEPTTLPSTLSTGNSAPPSTSSSETVDLLLTPSEATSSKPTTSSTEHDTLPAPSTSITRGPDYDTPKKSTRKRQGNPAKWKKTVRKSLCQTGQAYISVKGKHVLQRAVQANPCSSCKFKCGEKFTEAQREQLHGEYWAIQPRERKHDYICQYVTESTPERQKKTRKAVSRKYFFPVADSTDKIRVCKRFFLKTLDISDQSVNGPLKKLRTGLVQSCSDDRGRHTPYNKTPEADLQSVRNHIESFPSLESHYCRKDSKKQYLEASLNITKMYSLYVEQMATTRGATVSQQMYRKIFNTEYNFSFHKPKKDQCKMCRIHERSANPTEEEKKNYEAHQQRKRDIRASKEADKLRAATDPHCVACTFDLEKVLQTPSGLMGPLYYKRKLNCFNLCIYSLGDNKGYCYFWNESTGQKGSSEVATVLVKYLESLPPNVTHVTFYCDTCGGQNRNAAVVSALNYFTKTSQNISVVDLKFMESGHSQMEVDSMHAAIENQKAVTELFVPTQWTNIFRTARPGNPYTVEVMHHTDFLDFKAYAKQNLKNTKKDMTGRQIKWLKIKWFRFEKNEPDVVLFKDNITDHEFRHMRVSKKGQRGRLNTETVGPVQKYAEKLKISEAKKKDLLSLCTTGIIPDEFVPFFENLPCEKGMKDITQNQDVEDDSTDEDEIN